MAVLPGVLGCRPLRRTVQVRLGTNTLRLPGGTPIFVVSRQQFMIYPGLATSPNVSHIRPGNSAQKLGMLQFDRRKDSRYFCQSREQLELRIEELGY